MKKIRWIYLLIAMGFVFILINSCKKYTDTGDYTITDVEGNIYHTVTIGTQVWLVENLKVSTYNDGTAIPLVTDETEWSNLTTDAYCWCNDDSLTYDTYGVLYNWYAVTSAKLCPTGWHVPSDAEWTTLTDYLGGESVAGNKLREAGTSHWQSSNYGATNESGFTALPGGWRYTYGVDLFGYDGFWWSSSENYLNAYARFMVQGSSGVYRDDYIKKSGLSVRCLRD